MLDATANGRNELPNGIHRVRPLPDPQFGSLWESIHVDESLKTRLLSQAVLNFTIRRNVARTVLPLHGIILMIGYAALCDRI